jgi:hypothetical protein
MTSTKSLHRGRLSNMEPFQVIAREHNVGFKSPLRYDTRCRLARSLTAMSNRGRRVVLRMSSMWPSRTSRGKMLFASESLSATDSNMSNAIWLSKAFVCPATVDKIAGLFCFIFYMYILGFLFFRVR